MAISAERVLSGVLGLPKEATAHVPTVKTEPTLEEIMQREPIVWERIHTAAKTRDPEYIEEAKSVAREKGKLPGLFASIVLFNAEC